MKNNALTLAFTLTLFTFSLNVFSQNETETAVKKTIETTVVKAAETVIVKAIDSTLTTILKTPKVNTTDTLLTKTIEVPVLKTTDSTLTKTLDLPTTTTIDTAVIKKLNTPIAKPLDSLKNKSLNFPKVKTNDSLVVKKIDSSRIKKRDSSMAKLLKNLKFGMGFGLSFVGGTSVNIAPNVTYNVNDKIALGLGLQWNHLSVKDVRSNNTYGGNLVFQYRPIPKIMTLAEFAQLNVSTKSKINNTENNFWDSALFLGAGYTITRKISIGAKYNFLYDEDKSVYSTPIIPFVNISF